MAASLGWSSSLSWTQSIGGRSVPMVKCPSLPNTGSTPKRATFPIVCDKKVKKFHQVILKDDLETLGKKGEMVRVRVGYYRNYLLPLGKAQLVTPLLLKEMKLEEERIDAEKKRVRDVAEQVARALESVGAFKLKRKGGGGKQIFGRVTSQDLVDVIKSQLQRDVDKRIVTLPEIREIGEYIAEIRLHPEVIARVKVVVSSS